MARTKRSVLDDIQQGSVSLARPVLRRYRDARRQRSNDGKNTVPGYRSKPPPQGYVGISYESADDEKEDEDESAGWHEGSKSSAVEAAEAGEEDGEEEDEEELDFAEQDEERAYGHEMRPFGVPNPDPYRPAKRGRSGS